MMLTNLPETVDGMMAFIAAINGRKYSVSKLALGAAEFSRVLDAIASDAQEQTERRIVEDGIALAIWASSSIGPVSWAQVETAIRIVVETENATPTNRETLRSGKVESKTVEIPSNELARIISAR